MIFILSIFVLHEKIYGHIHIYLQNVALDCWQILTIWRVALISAFPSHIKMLSFNELPGAINDVVSNTVEMKWLHPLRTTPFLRTANALSIYLTKMSAAKTWYKRLIFIAKYFIRITVSLKSKIRSPLILFSSMCFQRHEMLHVLT